MAQDPARHPVGSDSSGLTTAQAAAALAEHGRNRLPSIRGTPWWRQLLGQLLQFFALVLWAAAALAGVAGLPELSVAIVAVILINGTFGFVQERRAERTGEKLRQSLPATAAVLRDGCAIAIDAGLVVPGDVLLLAEGDRVCADARCLDSGGLAVDTSVLTGESAPQPVGPDDPLLAGTFAVAGSGRALVTATGAATRFAHIAELAAGRPRPPTPLERDIRRLARTISFIALGVGTAFFVIMLLLGAPVAAGVTFGVGVIVSLVPESLLPTVTLSLAIGAERIADQHALVRRLESVETLGATTVICSDKTGTLTENRIEVVAAWTPVGGARVSGDGYGPTAEVVVDPGATEAVRDLARAARLCGSGRAVRGPTGWHAQGDPLEAAIDVLAARVGAEPVPEVPGSPVRLRPFTSRDRMAIAASPVAVVVTGAPEVVLERCRDVPAAARAQVHALAHAGLRVVAVARATWPTGAAPPPAPPAAPPAAPSPPDAAPPAPSDLPAMTLLGLLASEDPPRRGAAEAVASCRRAGIRLIMITGDHPGTGRAIADQVGLRRSGSPVLAANELPADDEALGALVDVDGIVLGRITPEDKLRIARVLRERGEVVAMTGDGVNDAPAMREADIGVAMGCRGTDVAREAADLVLLDDHFATIVSAVALGRTTFLNARRFLTYHLTVNVAELAPFLVWALSGGRLPLALGVLQLLALDLGTDTLPAIALGAEPPSKRVLERAPVTGALLNRTVALRAFGILGPIEAVAGMAAFTASLWALGEGWPPSPDPSTLAAASGAAFSAIVLCQCANAYACRSSSRPAWRRAAAANRLLPWAIAWALSFAAAIIFVPWLAQRFGQGPPPLIAYAVAAAAALALIGADGSWKWWRSRRARSVRMEPHENT